MSRRPCGRPIVGVGPCEYPRMATKQMCGWHWLEKQDADTQRRYGTARLERAEQTAGFVRQARVSRDLWPSGERWCSGCQSFVPLFYATGSRCKSCASEAAHEAYVQKTYGLGPGEYGKMYDLQGGRCYVCQRKSPSRRLAVDHDHVTNRVRGLLCPDPDRGCNHAILGPLEASPVGVLMAAKRLVLYLERSPYEQIQGAPPLTWREYVAAQAAEPVEEAPQKADSADSGADPRVPWLLRQAYEAWDGTPAQEPPF